MKQNPPSMEKWLNEAKAHESAAKCGMYLTHNGIVRQSAKKTVRDNLADLPPVRGMLVSYEAQKLADGIAQAYQMDGIYYIKVWINEGELAVGEDIMYLLIGGDIRSHVVDGLQFLLEYIKKECISERELF